MKMTNILTTVLCSVLLSATADSSDTARGSPCSTASKQSMMDINTAARFNYALNIVGRTLLLRQGRLPARGTS
eukprot:m.13810 g.13810  ORF g.13810 m.13810 type:complete len:73 (+) comp20637_c0_seq1:184-402(+)